MVALSSVLLVLNNQQKKKVLQSATQIFSRFTDQQLAATRTGSATSPQKKAAARFAKANTDNIRTTATIARRIPA